MNRSESKDPAFGRCKCPPDAGSFSAVLNKQQLYKTDEIHNCVERRLVQQIHPKAVFAHLLQEWNAAFVKPAGEGAVLCPFAQKRAEQKQKQPRKLKFTYKEQREYETIDDDIAALENKLETIERQIEANATNSVKLKELLEEQEEVQAKLDEKMERWVYLNDLAERIEKCN